MTVQDICVFIEYLADELAAPGSVMNYIALVRRYITDCDYPSQNWHSHRVKLALDALKQDKSHIPLQRPIISHQMLIRAFKYLARTPNTSQIRLVISILYFTALRQSEVIIHSAKQFDPTRHLTAADIYLHKGQLALFIKHAKNMSGNSQRRTVTLAPTGDPLTCPVTLFKDMTASGYPRDPRLPAFRRADHTPLLVSHVTVALRAAIASQGLDSRLYTLHSLRRTATTHAYQAKHTELDIQHSAAWSSTAYLAYIQTDSQSRVNQTLISSLHPPNHH